MTVIAEGIETEQEIEAIRGLGCEYVQGYYFYRPLTGEQVTTLLEN